jgi:2-oxoglutarate ferredoxin oxidoreductase subunit beta
MPRFRPAAIALAAGAGFIARGYAGKPADLTRLLVEAIEYRGFAFVHVLSPCQTFRPDQRGWKQQVHFCETTTDDPLPATHCIQQDDGLALGVLYRHPMSVWQPARQPEVSLEQLEQEFVR